MFNSILCILLAYNLCGSLGQINKYRLNETLRRVSQKHSDNSLIQKRSTTVGYSWRQGKSSK